MSCRAVVLPPAFLPSLVVQVKALACELPHPLGLPLSRLSLAELRRHVVTQGLVAEISGATLWRWLSSDALRPWQHRSWIFPRDPEFAARPARSWTCMSGCGRAARWVSMTSCSRRMKRPVCKPAAANSRPWRRLRLARCESSTSIFVKARGPTGQRGTSIAPKSSGAAKAKMVLAPWIDWSARS